MYSTCIFCRAALGHNDQVERFPVGRRLAFDARAGRLWVVCLTCSRWNLTPLEERWEAIEWCERTVRTVRPVAATDQIGLFKLSSGLELVRIGSAKWREVAAWRYGRRLWWRNLRSQAVKATTYLLPYAIGPFVVPYMPGLLLGAALVGMGQGLYLRRGANRIAYLARTDTDIVPIRKFHLETAILRPSSTGGTDDLALGVYSDRGEIELKGFDALRVASLALVQVNGEGGQRADIDYAIGFVGDAGSGEAFFANMARRVAAQRQREERLIGTILAPESDFTGPLARFPTLTRLALEIAGHEASEARALEGELADLIAAWREAEEIAKIADNLLIPASITRRLRQLRRIVRTSSSSDGITHETIVSRCRRRNSHPARTTPDRKRELETQQFPETPTLRRTGDACRNE